MKKYLMILSAVVIAAIAPLPANAQIGWTLEHCRAHFGKEYDYDVSDGTYTFHIGPLGKNKPIIVYDEEGIPVGGCAEWRPKFMDYEFPTNASRRIEIRFDPDGTVGEIRWSKYAEGFSEAEIQ